MDERLMRPEAPTAAQGKDARMQRRLSPLLALALVLLAFGGDEAGPSTPEAQVPAADWTLVERDDGTRYAVTHGQGSNGQVLSEFGGFAPFNYDVGREPELTIECHAYSGESLLSGPVSGEILTIGLRLNMEVRDYLSIRSISFNGTSLEGVPDDRWYNPGADGSPLVNTLLPASSEYLVMPHSGGLHDAFVSAALEADRLQIDWSDANRIMYSERFSMIGFAEVYASFSTCPLEGS